MAAALFAAPSAGAYGWPVRPFDAEHPVRGTFGDPRTKFWTGALDADGLAGTGAFSFHNGIDIAAPAGAPVFPVVSGVVSSVSGHLVIVRSGNRVFQYIHIEPVVLAGERVRARRTVLGYVQPSALHVHLTEIVGGRVSNPLAPGHIAPYRDTTKPRVSEILLRDPRASRRVQPAAVTGAISIVAVASDLPSLPAPGDWYGLPVSPAFVSWSLRSFDGGWTIRETVVADFRRVLPFNRDFWRVYARGTYQNKPRFGRKQYLSAPGRYEFLLTPTRLDTTRLMDDLYTVRVTVADVRGNSAVRTEVLTVCNTSPELCSGPVP